MDIQTPPPPPAHPAALRTAPAATGVLFVPAGPSRGEASSGGTPLMPVVARGATMEEARRAALEQARRDAAARGLPGEPRLRAEGYSEGLYSGLFEFAGDAAGSAAAARPAPAARPDWILVVPAEIGRDGQPRWGPDSEWSRAWRVPARHAGMRIVATLGDADDHDLLTGASILDPGDPGTAAAVASLARKYSAPAVALVRLDRGMGTVGAWMWRAGEGDAGEGRVGDAPSAATAAAHTTAADATTPARAAALDLLAEMAEHPAGHAEEGGMATGGTGGSPGGGPEARLIVGEHGPGGILRFTLLTGSPDPEERTALRRALGGIPRLALRSVAEAADGYELSGDWVGGGEGALALALELAGVRLAR